MNEAEALRRLLKGRVQPATRHFGMEADAAPTPRRAPGLKELLPQAEARRAAGRVCLHLRSTAPLTGERTAEGYVCPALDRRHLTAENLAVLGRDARWGDVDPTRIAFLDCETTSLAGGVGTCVFLIGLGRLTGESFELRQFFMEDYPEEPALIECVQEALETAQAIVSYNGRGFDVPLMEARWRLNRRVPRFPGLHLDLLHTARRLWRFRLADRRLETVEREMLGVLRVSDVLSAEIPSIYFEYLRGVRRERMLRVLDHHAQDIFSLGGLLGRLCGAVARPEDPRFDEAGEQHGLAALFFAAGREAEGIATLERAIVAARDEAVGFGLSMRLARRLLRAGRRAEAVAIWEARARQARPSVGLEPLLELAKHHEHHLKDPAGARRWAERALAILESEAETAAWTGREVGEASRRRTAIEAWRHRLNRLRRREAGAVSSSPA